MAPAWHFDDLPACIKDEAEMRLYCASQEVYAAYGVDAQRGALVLVRPDGMVSVIADLGDVGLLERLLGQVLVMREDVVDARK
jgi:phenol 2-monooxygenase